MRIDLDPRITVVELQRFAQLIGARLRALPDGGIAIVKNQPSKGDIKCQSTPSSTN